MANTLGPHRWTYDVFVSFRGEDIRKSFMDHLFKDFAQKGIHAFKDDNDVSLGQNISPQLDKVIEESKFLIVIFSKNYASSSWCLRELVKILECKQMTGHKHEVRIIFYDVKPDVVRKQTGSYALAFAKHEISNRTKVVEWKEALYEAANLSGWDLQDMANGFESKFIDRISKEILKALCHEPLYVGKNLVGVDARVNEMNLSRFVGSSKVHMIGICGISGLGKTTLAKAIYNSMSIHFEECSFCEDVQGVAKQQGLTQVQIQLIGKIMKTRVVEISSVSEGTMVIKQRMPTKPILLVLDDVDRRDQLEALAGSHDWFFPGSLIIFTGKDKQLLWSHKVDEIYDMQVLPYDKALELFILYAFGKNNPIEDFIGISNQVVKYLQGHPLALRILGGCLYDKPIRVWQSEVDRLQKYPNAEIQEKLRPSFDGLDYNQKSIFLDIACSLIGENKDFVTSVLDSADCFVYADLEVLVNKSLITTSGDNNSLQMHELIRSMARRIIHEEFVVKKVESRLWNLSEVGNVLGKNKTVEALEVLDLFLMESSQNIHIDGEAFENMKNLRILKVRDAEIRKFGKDSKVKYSGKLKSLPNKLRLLYWHGCPFEFPSNFYPENIVAIDLSYGHLKSLWTTPQCFGRLKVMKLRHCRNLTSTPNFTWITNIEELILEGCVSLVKVHPSVGMLKRLVVLNMKDCKSFKSFPCKVEMDSLQVMNLSGCSKLDKLPEFFGAIQTLREFYGDGTAITELPSFVLSQCNLQVLEFGRHEKDRSRRWTLVSRPSWLPSKMQRPQSQVMPSLARLCSLRELNFSYCNILQVSDSIRGLSCLESLNLDGNNFTSLPGWLSQLSRLRILYVSHCKKLEVLPKCPSNLENLSAYDCTSLHKLSGLLENNSPVLRMFFGRCPKLCRNLSIENQVSLSQPQPLDSSITSHSFSIKFSSLLQYMKWPSNICGISNAQESWFQEYREVIIIFHGNRIPQWFRNRSVGNAVKVELPPDWCISKLKGYGMCVVLTPKKLYVSEYNDCRNMKYCVNNFDGTLLLDRDRWYNVGCFEIGKSEIIWFVFTSRDSFDFQKAKNFVTFSFEDDDYYEVKECGVRLVFEEETNFSIIGDLPTPTKDGGIIGLWSNHRFVNCMW